MAKKQAGKISKVIGWLAAEELCNEVWDEFAARADEEFQKRIDDVHFSVDISTGGNADAAFEANAKRERLLLCKENFKTSFPAWRARGLSYLETALLKQSRTRKTGVVSSRHKPKKRLFNKVNRKLGRKPKKINAHKRKHRKTGRPRGWNNAKFVLPHSRAGNHPTVRVLRVRRAAARRARRIDARVKRTLRKLRYSKRLKRHWKPYNGAGRRKAARWLHRWLDGKNV